jgi:arylsulfatase A-like enzyme/Tfp pilus assembly protein PilF
MAVKRGVFAAMKPRLLMLGVAVAFAIAAVASSYLWWPRRPNVILVTFDTTRADHIGVYGYRQGLTESLDDFARGGVIFEQAYAPAPLTLVSHTTMLTGLYPPEHGLRLNGAGRLADEIPLLPELLRKQGYQTGAFVAAFVLDSKFGLERGFDVYDDDLSGTKSAGHSTDRRREGQSVVDAALAWMRKQTSKPFFCWIHLYDAHDPYDPRPGLFGEKFSQQPYDAGIAVEVQQLDRVVRFLREQKIDDRTLVIVAGDHGEGLGEHDEDEHSMFVYNSTLHVPLLIAGGRGFCQPGLRIAEPVSLVDLMPTVLDVLNVPHPQHVSGRSLRAVLTGGAIPSVPCYAETEAPFRGNHWCPLHTVISDRWKYIHTTRPELFDLEHDPREETNLAEADAERMQEMRSILETMQEKFVPAKAGNLNLSSSDLQKLAALGYLAGNKNGDTAPAEGEVLPDMKDMLPFCNKIYKAQALLRQGQFDEAGDLAREIIAATDKLPMAYVILGDVLRERDRLDEAEAAYRHLLDGQPDNAIAHAHLAVVYVKRGQFQQAADEFRRAIKSDPDGSQFHLDLAQTLTQLDKYDEAIFEYREALRADPGFVMAHFQLGLLWARGGRSKDAVRSFQQALKYDPGFVLARVNLVHLYLQSGQLQEASVEAKKAVELAPASFEAHLNLGIVLSMQHQIAEGIAQFEAAHELRPEDPRPQEFIRKARASMGQGN